MIKIKRDERYMLVAMEYALTMAIGDFNGLRKKYRGTDTGRALDDVNVKYRAAIEAFQDFAKKAEEV